MSSEASTPSPPSEEILLWSFPGWKLGELELKFVAEKMPTPEEISKISQYLTGVYGLRAQHTSVELARGTSWTDPHAFFIVKVVLRGRISK